MNGNFLSVMMHNHDNGKVIKMLEQLTELSKVMSGIRPQNQDELKMRHLGTKQEQNGEKG